MPILETEVIREGVRTGIWKITESAQELYQRLRLSDQEIAGFQQLKTDLRKRQWLAYRALVCDMLAEENVPVVNNHFGKPEIRGRDIHLSVSHTDLYAAVIIADRHPVGIDIEKVRDRVLRVRDKFLSPGELSMLDAGDIESHTLLWCAKEALYKVHGKKNLDFRKHISLHGYGTTPLDQFTGEIKEGGTCRHYKLNWKKIEDLLLVYVIDDEPHHIQ